jgi:alkanesulfonate monooxygenase SsuD/methylene tetrahydromethanopterin reductase-like flavin-dependent oxidoreductase (luciferase family)
MKVGLVLPIAEAEGQPTPTWTRISSIARSAEDAGIDSLWLPDHLIWRGDPDRGMQEAFTVLTAVAAVTTRVQLGPLVAATPYRSAGMLAKIAASLDDVAGGRLILGLGCGWYEPEFHAFGFPYDHRVGRFEEALAVILPLLRGERVTHHGRWTQVEDAVLAPAPGRQIPILIASARERMHRLSARHADAWNAAWFGLPDARWRERVGALREACGVEGRDPASLELTAGIVFADAGRDPDRVIPADASSVAAALDTWRSEGVGHVQVSLDGWTDALLDAALESIAAWS